MGFLANLIIPFLFLSCAKLSYISEQAVGQLSLEYADIDVENFLDDPSQSASHKEKVKLILKAKEFFYTYFDLDQVSIYDEVKMLDQDAVTYLVVHSKKDEIRAQSSWFPVLGEFPYLGFFSKNSAIEFVKEKEELGFQTYMRAVYAYSTLNHPLMPFDDNILSSFFFYQNEDLVELIFHELSHTIIFVKDNISFNENLASFIAERLRIKYYGLGKKKEHRLLFEREQNKKLTEYISEQVMKLKKLYTNASGDDYEGILNRFTNDRFLPSVKEYCKEIGLENCWPLTGTWNNARFAALGTYSDKQSEIQKIFKKSGLSLKDFVKKMVLIENEYDGEGKFLQYLEQKL